MGLDPGSILEEGETDDDVGAIIGSAPKATLRAFVGAALLAQVGLFALSLGVLLAYFRGQSVLGGGLVVGGVVALVATLAVVRRQRRED